ncbi:hypothetical protein [Sphingomonas aquatilis]
MALGAKFPPVTVFYDGKDHWLGGGFHRTYGAELTGATEIDAEVRQGTLRDAVLFSLAENATHGLRRTNADKRRAIARLFEDPEWTRWSDREIARRLHVDGKTVATMRPKVTAETRSERVFVNRHGSTSTMDVTNLSNRDVSEIPEAAPAVPVRGSRQLRTLLGEIRAGHDIEGAAIVAEIPLEEAKAHAVAEARGEYADIVAIEPAWKLDGDDLILRAPTEEEIEASSVTVDLPEPANDTDPTPPPAFDFAIAQSREAVMQAIAALAAAPSPDAMADVWAHFVGRGVPDDLVPRAAIWLRTFADLFPEAEARRQVRVAAMMEKL